MKKTNKIEKTQIYQNPRALPPVKVLVGKNDYFAWFILIRL